jgi:hypothetical protein
VRRPRTTTDGWKTCATPRRSGRTSAPGEEGHAAPVPRRASRHRRGRLPTGRRHRGSRPCHGVPPRRRPTGSGHRLRPGVRAYRSGRRDRRPPDRRPRHRLDHRTRARPGAGFSARRSRRPIRRAPVHRPTRPPTVPTSRRRPAPGGTPLPTVPGRAHGPCHPGRLLARGRRSPDLPRVRRPRAPCCRLRRCAVPRLRAHRRRLRRCAVPRLRAHRRRLRRYAGKPPPGPRRRPPPCGRRLPASRPVRRVTDPGHRALPRPQRDRPTRRRTQGCERRPHQVPETAFPSVRPEPSRHVTGSARTARPPAARRRSYRTWRRRPSREVPRPPGGTTAPHPRYAVPPARRPVRSPRGRRRRRRRLEWAAGRGSRRTTDLDPPRPTPSRVTWERPGCRPDPRDPRDVLRPAADHGRRRVRARAGPACRTAGDRVRPGCRAVRCLGRRVRPAVRLRTGRSPADRDHPGARFFPRLSPGTSRNPGRSAPVRRRPGWDRHPGQGRA